MSASFMAACSCGWRGTYTKAGWARVALARHSCERQQRLREEARAAVQREKLIDRTPKPCAHPIADHQHGTYAAYTLDSCRCVPCAAARSKHDAARGRAKAYGREPLVPAEPVRAHVAALKAAGLGKRSIAEKAGVSVTALEKLLNGATRDGRRLPPSRRMTRAVADAILAVPLPDLTAYAGAARIDATGTRRRLRALAALGWTVQRIADDHDLERQALDAVMRGRAHVSARVARAVALAYEQIGDRRPTAADRHQQTGITRTLNLARAAGWAPPAMWDPEAIDDPEASEPEGVVLQLPHRGVDLDEFVHLVRGGEHPERAAARLGVTLEAVRQRAGRTGRDDVLTILRRVAS